ncbi:MAG: folate family ECF transporter S component [Acholeplasmataceae bacterium]
MISRQINVQKLALSSMLAALGVILASPVFAFIVPLFGVPAVRIDLIAIPTIVAGLLLGPIYGLTVGILTDVLGFFLFTHVFGAYHFGFTLNLALAGLSAGLLIKLFRKSSQKFPIFMINIVFLSLLSLLSILYIVLTDSISINGTAFTLSEGFKWVFTGSIIAFFLVLLWTMIISRKKKPKDTVHIDRIIFIVLFIEVFVVILLTPIWVFQLYQAPPYIAGVFLRIIRAMWLIPLKAYLIYSITLVAKSMYKESSHSVIQKSSL